MGKFGWLKLKQERVSIKTNLVPVLTKNHHTDHLYSYIQISKLITKIYSLVENFTLLFHLLIMLALRGVGVSRLLTLANEGPKSC